MTKDSLAFSSSESILVIDDDASSLFLIQDLFSSMGLGDQVSFATNATDGLGILQDRVGKNDFPSFVFLDIRMPGVDGFGFLEGMESLEIKGHAKPKVVVLSYYSNRAYVEQAEQYGVSAYLRKPLTKENVIDVLF